MTPEGWQARLLSWALAIFATLAMVGAVATMSTDGGSPRPAVEVGAGEDRRGDPRSSEAPPPPPAPFTTGAPRAETPDSIAMARQAEATRTVSRWLEVLTYAVLALVAVLAVGVLALFRIAQALNDRNA
ncbi:hypothetical protein QLH51_15215 [Sphingomonas sp. 2R-10]|uniref:hypothetical protein n=1 Tax=Sphingomonas sp. 2R-10 TaxID=3045148 RepID=UPI000F7736A6|nr:hypothetical protein [Sphingomonas sp. 2R-10]MDJ0278147.1 hypothetical protein [Sphingomonas sp. 2R-10]